MIRVLFHCFVLPLIAVAPGYSQRLVAPLIPMSAGRGDTPLVLPRAHQAAAPQASVGRAVGFGLLLGAAGFVSGAVIGNAATRECDNAVDICIPQAAFFGAAGGGTLGMAAGVHLGNRRRGKFLLDFLVAAGVWATGILIAADSNDEDLQAAVLVAIPIVQLAATVAVERSAGRP